VPIKEFVVSSPAQPRLRARTAASGVVAAVAVGALVFALTSHGAAHAAPAATSTIRTASGSIGALRVTGGYIPKPANPGTAAVYFTVANTGSAPDSLLSVSSGVSKDVTLHRTIEHGSSGVMVSVATMAVPARGSLSLAVGGNHVMLENPAALVVGAQAAVTLHFARAGALTLEMPVVPLTATNDDLGMLDMTSMDMPSTGATTESGHAHS
jgi:copper(I)-binding protein